MKTISKLALSAIAATTVIAGAASAQDYSDWSTISPYGLEMVDQFGNVHYVDPYAYDSQVDNYGNVYSNYNYSMDPSVGMYDLTPSNQASTNSWSEYNSSAYTSTESSNWAPGGLYDTTWMFD
ncbi:hypothetical protein [Parvularcula marina]|uniref:hypothetical protein n=1 Tax=Parvularcula marina TaxID=2292771 RepID=UPI00351430CB